MYVRLLRGKTRRRLKKVFISLLVWFFAVIWFSPVFWMLSTSLKPTAVAVTENPPRWIPNPFTLENYRYVSTTTAGGVTLLRTAWNSLIVAIITTLATLFVATPAAYALARLRFPGRSLLFWTYVAVLAFPPSLFLIPNFVIIRNMGLMNTFAALILPGLGSTFGVFLLRQYMLGIPRELEDAALVDGCSRLRFLLSIVIPIVRPALIILGLMTFLGSWNNFLWPLVILTSNEKFTLPIGLVRLTAGWADPYRGIGMIMAGACLAVVPALVIFVAFRKLLMRGISLGSIGKG